MRAVVDANVFVSGLMLLASTPGRIIHGWRQGQFGLVMSEPMLTEIGAVLLYPKIRKRLAWDEKAVSRYLMLLRFESQMVDVAGVSASVPRDPADDCVLATLIASDADYLITGDADLLTLADRYPIVSPAEFAKMIF